MRRAALALAFTVAAASAGAQEARIRSGEHDTFTRFVVYLPQPAEYDAEAGSDSFTIDFDGGFAFDTTEVFYYIPRTRVSDVGSAPGRLDVALNCDCSVTFGRVSDTIMFFDVHDPGTVAEPALTFAPGPEPGPAQPPSEPFAPAVRLPEFAPESVATLLPWGLALADADETGEAEQGPGTSETTFAVAEQIARAAARGLVDVQEPVPPVTGTQRPASDPTPAEGNVGKDRIDPVEEESGPKRHLSIRSSVDEALGRDVGAALGELGLTGSCIKDDAFAVADWAPDGLTTLSKLKAKAVGELDRSDPEGVASLARAYIALTFGAEARHTLETFKVKVTDADVLLAMADIVDDGEARTPGRLTTQYDCPGPGALWAALAQPTIPDASELETDALTLAFSALPPQMRRHLGPTLAERLIEYGAVDTAAIVRSAIRRAPGAPTVEDELLDAAIALKTGREEEADAKLAEVVEETSGRSAAAVARLIERRLEEGEPIEDEVLASADALIYEHRGTPLAAQLSELRIEGLARNGQARRALAYLDDAKRRLSAESTERLRGISYAEAARALDDADFLLVAVNAANELGRSPEEMAARRAVARRLVEMGLPSLADSLGVSDDLDIAAAPAPQAEPQPSLREPLPSAEKPLERTAALLEHSAALRARLATALGSAADGQ